MVRGEIPTYLSEKRYLRKDGQPAWVQVTATVLRDKDGNPLRTISIIHDLAARKRTEQALRASEQRLQAILDHTEAVVYMKDTAGRYVLINRQFEALFHLRQDQLLGRRDEDLFPPDVAATLEANDRQVLASGRPIVFEEVIPQDDGLHTYLANKFAIADIASVPEAVCGIATDITERKRMETEARQAARDREVLLSIVSHDLKNPLAAILLNADILGRILPEGDDKARRRAESIRQTALRMAQLVHDLLDITRMQAGRLALTPEPLRLRSLINETLEAHETLAAPKGLHLGCQVQSDLPEIMADRARLQQVLANLIGNAVKFTPDHGSIHVKACRQDDHILVAVKDTGPGIAPEQQAHVFSRFWQPQESRHQGSGLGLAIAKGIVVAHGGEIWLQSTVGKGTTVYFTLPIGQAPVRQMPAEPAEEWRA
jgi:PAS domain S-box-containing protein